MMVYISVSNCRHLFILYIYVFARAHTHTLICAIVITPFGRDSRSGMLDHQSYSSLRDWARNSVDCRSRGLASKAALRINPRSKSVFGLSFPDLHPLSPNMLEWPRASTLRGAVSLGARDTSTVLMGKTHTEAHLHPGCKLRLAKY